MSGGERYIEVAGDAHKIEPTRHHFAAVRASLMTARDYLGDIERENAALRAALAVRDRKLRELREAARAVVEGAPYGFTGAYVGKRVEDIDRLAAALVVSEPDGETK